MSLVHEYQKTSPKQYIPNYLDLVLGTNMLRSDFQDSYWSNLCNSKLEKDWFIINLPASFTIGIYWSLKLITDVSVVELDILVALFHVVTDLNTGNRLD